jgi:hypothetical protein
MILVIEDNDGAAWTVLDEVESLDLSSTEGIERLTSSVKETIDQIYSETDDYKKICDSTLLDPEGGIPLSSEDEDFEEEDPSITDAIADEEVNF